MSIDGTTNGTQLMQRAFEDSGYIEKGHGKDLAWHEGLPTYEQANEQRKDAAAKPMEWALDKAKEAAPEFAMKKVAERMLGKQVVEMAEFGMNPAKSIAGRVVTEGGKAAIAAIGTEAMIGGGMALAGVVTVAAAVKTVADGDKMARHQNTIALDLAATQLLQLDADYKHSVYKKYEGNCEPDTVMKKFRNADGSLTAYGKQVVPQLQAACDDGSRAAFDCVRSGNIGKFLQDHPALAARRQSDVAFAKGFDQVLFAANAGDGGHKLVAIKRDVDSRDARMHETPSQVRG